MLFAFNTVMAATEKQPDTIIETPKSVEITLDRNYEAL